MLTGEPLGRRDRDEELRAVSVRAGVRHCEFAGPIELMRRAFGFILELITGAAHASALRIATLDHEVGNHAMKNGAIVQAL